MQLPRPPTETVLGSAVEPVTTRVPERSQAGFGEIVEWGEFRSHVFQHIQSNIAEIATPMAADRLLTIELHNHTPWRHRDLPLSRIRRRSMSSRHDDAC